MLSKGDVESRLQADDELDGPPSSFPLDPLPGTTTKGEEKAQPTEVTAEHTSSEEASDPTTPAPPVPVLKLISCGLSFFVAGTNDGSIGTLIPYILKSYNVGTSLIAALYSSTFAGWLFVAVTNNHALKFLDLGALLSLGALFQIIPHVLRAWKPPYGLFAVAFFLSGLGQAYQDSHANTFVSTVSNAHRWLAFIHASYGLGLLVAPFVAASISAHKPDNWALFYIFPMGLGVINLVLVLVAFRESIRRAPPPDNGNGETQQGRNKSAMNDMKELLKMRSWIVEFLVKVRDGELAELGYVPAGAAGGVVLGRLLLAEPTHRFGERRMLCLYTVISFAAQLVFWLVPNMISSIAMFTIIGFVLGPFFAAVSLELPFALEVGGP
ncbi:hypothetical protein FQN54_009820 [Arachnomyces sp. PD_36]|nr:hypothetical protein FQN54_009820 [Arachnomyces sp. PD_36]